MEKNVTLLQEWATALAQVLDWGWAGMIWNKINKKTCEGEFPQMQQRNKFDNASLPQAWVRLSAQMLAQVLDWGWAVVKRNQGENMQR